MGERPLGVPVMPNARPDIAMCETHEIPFPVGMCPVSGMPLAGSVMRVSYTPGDVVLDVLPLGAELRRYAGGKVDGVRNMEEVSQHYGQRMANALGVPVDIECAINLLGDQVMRLKMTIEPRRDDA